MIAPVSPCVPVTVSGLYRGRCTAPDRSGDCIELRVDIDVSPGGGLPLRIVSGDLFERGRSGDACSDSSLSTPPPITSWIAEDVAVTLSANGVDLTGQARFGDSARRAALCLRIEMSGATPRAVIVLTAFGELPAEYHAEFVGPHFRELEIHVDVCASVAPLRLPVYRGEDRHHDPDGSAHGVTIESAFMEAGVLVTLHPGAIVADPPEGAWTDATLQRLCGERLGTRADDPPAFRLWALLARGHRDSARAGCMFATAPPHRQGIAIFLQHSRFSDQASRGLAGSTEASTSALPSAVERLAADEGGLAATRAERFYLYSWMHEIGHALNLMHSGLRGRSSASSWMNEAGRYTGAGSFWDQFPLRFDREELVHLRHGFRSAVAMGGDALSVGSP